MSQFEDTNGYETASCTAQLSSVLQMPGRIDIPTFQNIDFAGEGSNHTTPLNYMRSKTTPLAVQRLNQNQGVTYSEVEEERELEIESRFNDLHVPSSHQDTFFEFQNSTNDSLESLEPLSNEGAIGELRRGSHSLSNSWDFNARREIELPIDRFGNDRSETQVL